MPQRAQDTIYAVEDKPNVGRIGREYRWTNPWTSAFLEEKPYRTDNGALVVTVFRLADYDFKDDLEKLYFQTLAEIPSFVMTSK